jgi:energy-coupling factor transport system ATP-binding protein
MAQVADRILNLDNGILQQIDISEAPHTIYPAKSLLQTRSPTEPILSTKNVSFSYSRHTAIDNVSVSIQGGELIALMGDNGSGKTTLLNLLAGLQTPLSGEVLLYSERIQSFSKKDVAEKIGVVFQNPNHQLFERTVWKEQNLTLHALDLADDTHLAGSEELLEEAGLASLRDRNPFSLSHGQKRRLNITSILAHSPEILLLDEPFVGQDRIGQEFIIRVLHQHAIKGGAAVIITHDMECAQQLCNRILFLENASLLLDGSPSAVMKQLNGLDYADYTEVSP